jgi:trans-feruloyl-CoA hydratase/vanillin synthase
MGAQRRAIVGAKQRWEKSMSDKPLPGGKTVLVEIKDRIAWVTLNRPEKRNAISPELSSEMLQVLDALEPDERVGVVVLTGAGNAYSGGMDLREFFRASDPLTVEERAVFTRSSGQWQWRRLSYYLKPTIAMVNGWCFGGAFNSMIACDIAIAADEATFGLSEVNWGILPGGIVSKVIQMTMSHRDALFYAMTGRPFTGKQAAEMRLVNYSVPLANLRDETVKLCKELMEKPPMALAYTKQAVRAVATMDIPAAAEYLAAKSSALRWVDRDKNARDQGIEKFIDKKEYRPGLQTVKVT